MLCTKFLVVFFLNHIPVKLVQPSKKKRKQQHLPALRTGDSDHSGAVQHSIESGHDMDWSNMKPVVFNQQNYKNRKLQEAIEILQNHDNCWFTHSGNT